jgi:hypothetical protein
MEKRGGALIDIDKEKLHNRMEMYYDSKNSYDTIKHLDTGLSKDAGRFDAKVCRAKLLVSEKFSKRNIKEYLLRPFDQRWCFYSPNRPLWNEPRPALWNQYKQGNKFLVTRPAGVASPEGVPFYYTELLGDNDFLRGHAYYIPITLFTEEKKSNQVDLFESQKNKTNSIANLSEQSFVYLSDIENCSSNQEAEQHSIFFHCLSIGFSLEYLEDNADGIKRDWPRIPLPNTRELLEASAELGRQIADLLNPEANVKGVTAGQIREEIKFTAVVSCKEGKSLDPNKGHLKLNAGWGHQDTRGAVMPGRGNAVQRSYTDEENDVIKRGAEALGLSFKDAKKLLGNTTYDVYLNETAYWKNIPEKVWEYTIGGYQVIKKWLSYREHGIIQRDLKIEEVREVTNMARRITAIILMQPELDANYQRIKENTYPWPKD